MGLLCVHRIIFTFIYCSTSSESGPYSLHLHSVQKLFSWFVDHRSVPPFVGDTTGSCGDPGIPSQGSREQTDFRIRSKVHFSCSEGYELIGSSERMCFPNGTWSGTQPFCKRRKTHLPYLSLLQPSTLTVIQLQMHSLLK